MSQSKPSAKHTCPRHLKYNRVPGKWRRELLPALPERAFTIPDRSSIPYGEMYCVTKGEFLAIGATAFIDRLNAGNVVKYPKPNPYCSHEEDQCRQEIKTEAEVYQRIGHSPRVPTLIHWHQDSCSLVLNYFEHGDLETYTRGHASLITPKQRECWMVQAAEALAVVHAADVIHCDVTPRNFLLDQALQLYICDFAGSSISGSLQTKAPGPRFQPPGWDWRSKPKTCDDIFALGSVFYFIQTGNEPYHDVSEDEVETHFNKGNFPDVSMLSCGNIIRQCWAGECDNAHAIVSALNSLYKAEQPSQL